MYTFFENVERKIYVSHTEHSYYFKSHFHNKVEITYCFSGFQKIKIGEVLYTLSKGDTAVIFPNVVHEYLPEDSCRAQDTECVSIISETDFFAGIMPDIITKRPAEPVIKKGIISDDTVTSFRKIVDAKSEAELVGWTLVALSDIIKIPRLIPVKETDSFSLAPNLISYIDANFNKPLTIKLLAKEFGYSPSYIAHIFHDQLNIPFRTYLGAVRSEYAAGLIRSTNKRLTDIAYECGCDSLNTFCRCFKRHFQKTPSEYKKSHKISNNL